MSRPYIQSGNVLFSTRASNAPDLTSRIERMLGRTFDYSASVVLRSQKQMQATVDGAPAGFGAEPDRYRYDVIFLQAPLTAAAAMKTVSAREGVDQADGGPGVLYFSRFISRASQSHLSKIVASPIYKQVTIRNWNTTTKLLHLMGG